MRYADTYHKINVKDLLSQLRYDEVSGRLYRRYGKENWRILKRKEHSIPGYVFMYKGFSIAVHDAVWLIHKKEWPKDKLIAMDGDLCNTRIDNLMYQSDAVTEHGKYSLSFIDPVNMVWEVCVWHHPFFAKRNQFRNKLGAEAWAKAELRMYNRYAVPNELMAETTSESNKKIPIPGIYNFPERELYEVKVRRADGQWRYHCYTKTIEDAIESQRIGQAEIDEVWKMTETMDATNSVVTKDGRTVKRNYLIDWHIKRKEEKKNA